MMPTIEDAIREHAYHLWINDGRPEGRADAYWLAAQRALLDASLKTDVAYAPAPRVEPVVVAKEEKYPAKKAKASAPRKAKRRAA
jgi:hypothetical protein